MKTVLELLVAGRDLISDHERWTTECMARTAEGKPINPASNYACRWCAMGALVRLTDMSLDAWRFENARIESMELLNRASYEIDPGISATDESLKTRHVAYLNDGPDGHARVLRAYDIAIERARAKEAGG